MLDVPHCGPTRSVLLAVASNVSSRTLDGNVARALNLATKADRAWRRVGDARARDEANVATARAWLIVSCEPHAAWRVQGTSYKRPASVRFEVSRHVIGRARSCLSVECVERARWIARARKAWLNEETLDRESIATTLERAGGDKIAWLNFFFRSTYCARYQRSWK